MERAPDSYQENRNIVELTPIIGGAATTAFELLAGPPSRILGRGTTSKDTDLGMTDRGDGKEVPDTDTRNDD